MGQLADALGIGASISYNGKTYQIAPWTFEIQGKYERYLEEQAILAVRRNKHMLPEDEYGSALKGVMQDIAAGEYSFGSDLLARSLKKLPHITYLIYLCLEVNHPDISLKLVQDMVKEKIEEFIEKMDLLNNDPNSTSLAAGGK
jgi:hypothetical protein